MNARPSASRARIIVRTIIPRVFWTVVERDGQPEFVVWREWLGNAYDITSVAGSWGRWDRHRISSARPLPEPEQHPAHKAFTPCGIDGCNYHGSAAHWPGGERV